MNKKIFCITTKISMFLLGIFLLIWININTSLANSKATEGFDTDYVMSNAKLKGADGVQYTNFIPGKNYNFQFDIKNQGGFPFLFTFGGSGTEHFEKHIFTKDGGFIGVGRSNSKDGDLAKHGNKGGYDAIIVKYDYKGKVEWSKTFGGSGTDFFYHAVQTQDGNYIAVGTSSSTNGDMAGAGVNGNESIMVKYDANGKFMWKQVFHDNGTGTARILYVLEDKQGNLYTTGEECIYTKTIPGGVYRKHDKFGNEIWKYTTNSPSRTGGASSYGITLMSNGDILGVGKDSNTVTSGPYKGNFEPYILRLNGITGELMWREDLSGNTSDDLRQVVEADDGTLIAIGRTSSNTGHFSKSYNPSGGSSMDGYVAKFNKSNGDLLDLKIVGGYGYDNARYMEKLKDGSYLISGNTNQASGDFAGLKLHKNQDAVWYRMRKDMTIDWFGQVAGSEDDATQAGMQYSNNSYVVSGETKSTDGDFKGLNKGGQDAFIGKLDKSGKVSMERPDEIISQIQYKIVAKYKNGTTETIKTGSFYNQYVEMDKSITKSINFTTPDSDLLETLTLTATLYDSKDTNDSNNSVQLVYNIEPIIGQDFSVDGYNVKHNNVPTGQLEIGKTYSFNTKISNRGIYSTPRITIDNVLDVINYKVTVWDGINNSSKKVLTSGTKRNQTVSYGSSIWNSTSFTIPNDNKLNEVIMELSISDTNDKKTNNNSVTVKMPIYYKIENDIGIKDDKNDPNDGVTIYPVSDNKTPTTADDCYVVYGAPTNIKAIVGSSNIKTQNLKATLVINDKNIETKTVYGVSSDSPGAVYFNYILNDKNNLSSETIKIQVKISPADGTKEYFTGEEIYKNLSDAVYAKVIKPINAIDEYNVNANNRVTGLSIGESVAYIKVKKKDRDKLVNTKHTTPCQTIEDNTKVCPGHPEYIYNDDAPYYDAFIPVDTIKLENIEQNYKITSIKYKSKYTSDNKDSQKIKDISSSNNGFINILDSSGNVWDKAKEHIKVKAGYGFELEIDTKYNNNLPEIYEKVRLSNSKIEDTPWSTFENYPNTNIKVLYNDVDNEVKKYTGAIGVAVPSINDIAIHNLPNLFIKTPASTEEFLKVKEGVKDLSETNKYKVSTDKKLYEIDKKYKIVSKRDSSLEKYYVNKEVENGSYEMKIFTPLAGIGAICDTSMPKIKDTKTFNIKVYGGYLDDIKTHLNE